MTPINSQADLHPYNGQKQFTEFEFNGPVFIRPGVYPNGVSFTRCKFNQLITIDRLTDIEISDCRGLAKLIDVPKITIRGGHLDNFEMTTSRTSAPMAINLLAFDAEFATVIVRPTANSTISMNNSTIGLLQIVHQALDRGTETTVILTETNISKNLEMVGTVFKLEVKNCKSISKITKSEGPIASFVVTNSSVDEIITPVSHANTFTGLTSKLLNTAGGNLDLIDCKVDLLKTHNPTVIKGSEIGTYTIDEKSFASTIQSHNTKFKNLIISNIETRSPKKLEFHDTSIIEQLKIEKSALDGTIFNRFYFEDKAKLEINQSSITDAKYYSIKWPKNFKIVETVPVGLSIAEQIKRLWDIREAYRQLKVVSLDFHNKFDAKKFQVSELEAYYKAQTLEAFKAKSTRPSFLGKAVHRISEIGNWILLFTNKWFSAFGESYGIPIFWLLFFHFLFFRHFMPDLGIEFSSRWPIDTVTTGKAIDYYFYLLSPVHNFEIRNLSGTEVSIIGMADFFMRIFAGYFIYYFIRATRKYNFNV